MTTTFVFFFGIFLGLILGAMMGIIIMACCAVAGKEDERRGRE